MLTDEFKGVTIPHAQIVTNLCCGLALSARQSLSCQVLHPDVPGPSRAAEMQWNIGHSKPADRDMAGTQALPCESAGVRIVIIREETDENQKRQKNPESQGYGLFVGRDLHSKCVCADKPD